MSKNRDRGEVAHANCNIDDKIPRKTGGKEERVYQLLCHHYDSISRHNCDTADSIIECNKQNNYLYLSDLLETGDVIYYGQVEGRKSTTIIL